MWLLSKVTHQLSHAFSYILQTTKLPKKLQKLQSATIAFLWKLILIDMMKVLLFVLTAVNSFCRFDIFNDFSIILMLNVKICFLSLCKTDKPRSGMDCHTTRLHCCARGWNEPSEQQRKYFAQNSLQTPIKVSTPLCSLSISMLLQTKLHSNTR